MSALVGGSSSPPPPVRVPDPLPPPPARSDAETAELAEEQRRRLGAGGSAFRFLSGVDTSDDGSAAGRFLTSSSRV